MDPIKVAGRKIKQSYNTAKDLLALHESVRTVLDNPEGERVLRYLMKISALSHPKLTTDTSMLLIREGQQQIVLTLLRILGKDPQYLIEQIKKGQE